MTIFGWLFGSGEKALGMEELARRLDLTEADLRQIMPHYREFNVPKRSGGTRRIHAPEDTLKSVQRRILYRLLLTLKAHDAAKGFEEFESIVTNARPHVGQAVLVKLDLVDFFQSTSSERINAYFKTIGWDKPSPLSISR